MVNINNKLYQEVEKVNQIPIVSTILEVICRSTGMGFAAIARVTEDRWIACSVRDEIQFGLQAGGELKVETTICDEIRDSRKAVIIDNVEVDGMFCKHHTPKMYGFKSYISFPIILRNGEFFGTLCAIDPQPAQLNNSKIIGMFTLFAELISFHLQTENKLQSTLDGVPAIIALLEVRYDEQKEPIDFVISSANKAMAVFSNSSVEALVGKTVLEQYPEAFRGELMESCLKVFKTGEPLDIEFLYPGLDRWFAIFVTKQDDGSGIVVVALDIAEKKKIEGEQRQIQVLTSLDKIKTEFFSNISHEFRTPLTLILGPLEEAMGSKRLTRAELHKLEMVHRNALRLQRLVNSLLDFSRMEAGRFDTVYQPTNLCSFTTLLASNFRSAMDKAGLKFIVNLESVELVYVNRSMWEKIVFNLLSNAFKFTFKGAIEIQVKSNKNHVQLHVRDTGIGISGENLSKIFERFVRIENIKARTYEGSGIGLALVRELVSMHGGSIKVKSKVGSGSEFIVSIPKGKKHLPQHMIYEFNDNIYNSTLSESYKDEAIGWLPGQLKKTDKAQNTKTKPIVLLVDDNADLREYIRGVLEYSFEIVEAINGNKANELLNSGLQPDLILADVMMPEMNGFDLLRAVKANKSTVNIPFVFLSAKASEEDRIEGIRQGGDHYLTKPFSANELLAIVKSKTQAHHPRMSETQNYTYRT